MTATSPTLLGADIIVNPNAAIGFRSATVTTGSAVESRSRSIFVGIGGTSLAEVTSVLPAQGARGQTLDVAVIGSNTNFVNGVTTAGFGNGITVNSVTETDATHATTNVHVDPAATVCYRDVVLATGGENVVLLNGFYVADVAVGDVNADGSVNVSDVFYLINYLFAGGPAPIGPGNVSGDGTTNVADVFYMINYLFAGGPAPV